MARVFCSMMVLSLAMSAAAHASDETLTACDNSDDPRVSIPACTSLIEAGTEPDLVVSMLYSNRGFAYFRFGEYAKAISDETKALQGKNDKRMIRYERYFRALAYCYSGDYPNAMADFKTSFGFGSDDANIYNSRGLCYLKMKNYGAAIADYDTALESMPNVSQPLYGRGIAKLWRGDASGAEEDIAKAKKIQANVADVFAQQGIYRPLADGFYLVSEETSPLAAETAKIQNSEEPNSPPLTVSRQPVVPIGAIASADVTQDSFGNTVISIVLTKSGGELMGSATSKNIGRRMAIVANRRIVSVATIQGPIRDTMSISGRLTLTEANAIASHLQTSSLAARNARAAGQPALAAPASGGATPNLLTPAALCGAVLSERFEQRFDAKNLTWRADTAQPSAYFCSDTTHEFPGQEGDTLMFTYEVQGTAAKAKVIWITTEMYVDKPPLDIITTNVVPMLQAVFAASGMGTPPQALVQAVQTGSVIHVQTPFAEIWTTFKPGDNPTRPNSGARYDIEMDLH